MNARLTFWNGTDGATGSEFMITYNGRTLLVDCGLLQGSEEDGELNHEVMHYHASSVDVVLVTHAHADHIGRIPKLVKEGFSGIIFSTEPTKALAEVMFQDSLKVMALHERRNNEKPLYDSRDVITALSLWKTVPYRSPFEAIPGLVAQFKDAGHILGSSMVELKGPKKSILFTGDLGNSPHDLLCDTEDPGEVQYIVMESVYGDRAHAERSHRTEELAEIIHDVVKRNGPLLIPVFSLERSQDILYELNELIESGKVPKIPVFLDSPLAIDITRVYERYTEFFNEEAQDQIKRGDNIFDFPGLLETYTVEESKNIDTRQGAKIILAGSGMSHGGRIQHHEIHHLSDPRTTILFVGYQMPGSVGRRIIDGERTVTINNRKVKVRAHVETIFSYSAHKDSPGLQAFASSASKLEKLFIVLGEPKSRMYLAQRLYEYHQIKATLPNRGESFEIDL
jgi:metallo-beta-lactamase family protein